MTIRIAKVARVLRLLLVIGAVGGAGSSHAGLLHPGINRKRRPGRESCYVQELPAFRERLPQRLKKVNALQRQCLNQA